MEDVSTTRIHHRNSKKWLSQTGLRKEKVDRLRIIPTHHRNLGSESRPCRSHGHAT